MTEKQKIEKSLLDDIIKDFNRQDGYIFSKPDIIKHLKLWYKTI